MNFPEFHQMDCHTLERIELDGDGADCAVDAAGQYAHAGFDDHLQLMIGIKAYLWALTVKKIKTESFKVLQAGHVQMPMCIEEANTMIKIGQMYVASHLTET